MTEDIKTENESPKEEIEKTYTMPECVFCGRQGAITSIGIGDNKKGICSSCSRNLMRELLKTAEWKKVAETIAKSIKDGDEKVKRDILR